jgi:transposase
VTEVVKRFGVSRPAVHRWIGWYREERLDGLADRSRRRTVIQRRQPAREGRDL